MAAALAAALLLATASAAAAAEQRSLQVHNPSGVTVTAVHMVLSSHFDGGCKVSAHARVPVHCCPRLPQRAQAAAHATLPTRQPDTAAIVVLSLHTATGFA